MPFSEHTNPVVRKSNELIEARYKLSISEQRLILLLASAILPDDEDFKGYEIRVADFAKMFGLESDKSLYEKVQNAAEGLLSRKIVLQDNKTKEIISWLSYVKYEKGSGLVNLEFHRSLKPYLLQLKKSFTQYQLNYVIDFKSQYSIRLYELLKMNAFKAKQGQFEKSFELQEYRDLLGVDKKAYSAFADFRKYVIQPLVTEISDKTDLVINDIKYGKTGRKITHITFWVTIRSESETKLQQVNRRIDDIKPERTSDHHPIVDALLGLGFSLDTAKTYKNKYGVKKIERNIAYTLAKQHEGKIKDIPAYLNMAIEKDYGGGVWDLEQKKKAEAQKEHERLVKEKLSKKAKEEKAEAERKVQLQHAFKRFLALPEQQQNDLREQFLQVADNLTRQKASASMRQGEPFYKSPIVFNNFKIFLDANKLV